MKRLQDNLLRCLSLLILSVVAAVSTAGQAAPPPFFYSTGDKEYWYVIHFCSNENLVLTIDGTMLKARTNTNGDGQKWKMVAAETKDYYHLVSKNGKYVSFSNSRFRIVDNVADAVEVHLITESKNDHPDNWQIQRKGSSNSMNPFGGLSNGSEIGEWGTDDVNNPFVFELVDGLEMEVFMQFSSYGRLALYDDGTSEAPMARMPADGVTRPTDSGYTWTRKKTAGGCTLRSGHDRYVGLSADGNSLKMVDSESEAAVFADSYNDYAADVRNTGGRPVTRLKYVIDGKAIAVDAATGAVTLSATTDARNTVLRETQNIEGGVPPVIFAGTGQPVWYNISFTYADMLLAIGEGNNRPATLGTMRPSKFDPTMMWYLEQTGTSAGDGEFYLRNAHGDYLHWNTTALSDASNDFFSATADKSAAAVFRLAEYTDYGADRVKWMLHYIGSKRSHGNYQYLRPRDNNTSIKLTPAGDLSESPLLFEKYETSLSFYDDDDDLWRQIYFQGTDYGFDNIIKESDGNVVAGAPSSEIRGLWKNVGTADDFILKNYNGKYLALNETQDGYVFTDNKDEAAHFSAALNSYASGASFTYVITDKTTGKLLSKDETGKVVLLSPEGLGDGEEGNSSIFFFLPQNLSVFRPSAGQYYKIGTDGQWLNDGLGDVYDAICAPIGKIKDNTEAVANDFLWTFVEDGDAYILRNRNGIFLAWNIEGDQSFGISNKENEATRFLLHRNNSTGYYYMYPSGGLNIGDNEKGQTLYFSSTGYAGLSSSGAGLEIIPFTIYEAEDYTQYKILPKRSWFVRLAADQKETSNSFIHSTPDGTYGRKDFTLSDGTVIKRQNTNDYRIIRYMKRNTMRELRLPSAMYAGSSGETRIRAYQRWYDYNTDGLVPDSLLLLNQQSRRNYANGTLMGSLLRFNNHDGQFVSYGFNFKMPDNVPDDYEYTLGIDMSLYTDFVDYYGENGGTPHDPDVIQNNATIPVNADLIEPTLSSRCIYVVRNAHIMARQLTALPESQDKWLEEYNVNYPARKVNFRDCSLPLDNEFGNYWIYRGGVAAEENLMSLSSYSALEFRVTNNTAGIAVEKYPIAYNTSNAGANVDLSTLRFIRFKYSASASADAVVNVPNGSTADIEIYATDGTRRYRLAVYHLTFTDGIELRPYTEIIGLKADGTPKSQRSPRQLRRDLGEPKAYISFDFNEYESFKIPPVGRHVAFGGNDAPGEVCPNTYRYPIRYENAAYAFEPTRINSNGTVKDNSFGSYTIAKTIRFSWGNNARFYPVRKYYHDEYPDEGYEWDECGFLYIDASECPGRVVSLDFDGNICKGTRITVSAWVSSPNSPNHGAPASSVYANMFFNILGYYTDAQGVEHEEKIYTYCPGPISGDGRLSDGTTLQSTTDQTGVWQQVYFTFIPRSKHIISRFVLNVNNACTSSAGGDILIDDIEVYAATPSVSVGSSLPVCDSQLTLTQIESDYETLLDALGIDESELGNYRPAVSYCVVDYDFYNSEKERLEKEGDPTPANTAMRNAAVGSIRRVNIDKPFAELPPYNYSEALSVTRPTIWSNVDDNGLRQLIVSDKIVSDKMLPGKRYYLAAYFSYSNETVDFSNFQVGTDCSVSTQFVTHKSFTFIIDGSTELPDGEDASACAGSNVTMSAKFRGISTEDGSEATRVLPCDWWLNYYGGDFDAAYIDGDGNFLRDYQPGPNDDPNIVSVSQALESFRFFYPDALSVDATCRPASDAVTRHRLTQAMIDGLRVLSEPVRGEGGRPALLLLHRRSINLQIPSSLHTDDEFVVTIQPIDGLVDADEDLKDCIVCFDANSLAIRVNGEAPGLLNGFSGITYPSYMTNVPLRLTLEQVKDQRTRALRVPLRAIHTVTPGATGLENIPLAGADNKYYTPVYLADTSDPTMSVLTDRGELVEVGRLTDMQAVSGAADTYADITFLPDFKPHEGHTYTLRLDYRESLPADVTPNTCNGSVVFDLMIVPRYVVWTGAAGNTDWTNDLNWRRADRADLRYGADYLTNEDNTTAAAFVPVDTTSVIVAPHAEYQPALYAVAPDAEGVLDVTGVHKDEVTPDIVYHLLCSEQKSGPYVCQPFRTYRCSGLVLQAGAELLQAQHLDYWKAWTEHEVEQGRWYTLGTPLREIYAGDWYAPTKGGREDAPYFRDINFKTGNTPGREDRNDRFAPAVYQRGWDKGTANLYYLLNPTDPATVADAPQNVFVRAEWSSVYNDVNVPYTEGGFSLKAEHEGSGRLLFRLPKEDKEYYYFVKGNDNGSNKTGIKRTAAHHRLWTDLLLSPDGGFTEENTFTVTAPNNVAANDYHLVGNPFPCGLDMNAFFQANAGKFEAEKFWVLTAAGQSAVMKDTGSNLWISVNAGETAAASQVLASGQGFFVKLKSGQEPKFVFNAGMMVSATSHKVGLKAPQRRGASAADVPVLRVRAERAGRGSEAVLVKSASAVDTYEPSEDMETLLDATQDASPTVFTLAGRRAVTLNRRRSLSRVGLGVTGRSDEEVRLTFTGMDSFFEDLSLLDAATGRTTLLSTGADTVSVTVPGQTAGRFFIVSSAADGEPDAADASAISVTVSRGEVTVAAPAAWPLEEVRAVAADGRTLHLAAPGEPVHKFRLDPGVYIITARSAGGVATRKVTVGR